MSCIFRAESKKLEEWNTFTMAYNVVRRGFSLVWRFFSSSLSIYFVLNNKNVSLLALRCIDRKIKSAVMINVARKDYFRILLFNPPLSFPESILDTSFLFSI